MKKPLILIIMDGFGLRDSDMGNAIHAANHPNLTRLFHDYPTTQLGASGMDVGLPDGQMGNSEVGHTNIGAGRVVYQELTRITKSIQDGPFFDNEAFLGAVENCKKNDSALHLFGLLSDGGVHSHIEHIFGLLDLAKKNGLTKVFVHCFMDGRDVPPTSGIDFVKQLQAKLDEIGIGKIATINGRYYAMDRDNRFERLVKAYSAMVYGEGAYFDDPVAAVQASYDAEVTDEFIVPVVTAKDGQIKANDSIIFANFRPDRAREITRTFVDPEFTGFERKNGFFPVYFVCMTQYDATMPNVHVAFKPQQLVNTFGEYIADNGLTQLRIAETEKYAHVTFFFNGGVEKPCEGEERCLVPSPKEFPTYDLIPEMSAAAVADKCVEAIKSDEYEMIVCNFANCDMVGHTGVIEAAVKAVETVDGCMGKVYEAVRSMPDTVLLVTADHGNADCMTDAAGKVNTAHTTNPVPFAVCCEGVRLRSGGRLADIAPTMLDIMNIPKPAEMSGNSLIIK